LVRVRRGLWRAGFLGPAVSPLREHLGDPALGAGGIPGDWGAGGIQAVFGTQVRGCLPRQQTSATCSQMHAAANAAEAAAAPDVAAGLGGMLAGGGGGGGAPPAGPVILLPPVGKTLHPGFRHETAQALLALGRSLEPEAADSQVSVIIPMSITTCSSLYFTTHPPCIAELRPTLTNGRWGFVART
jgi:hypothetical protein